MFNTDYDEIPYIDMINVDIYTCLEQEDVNKVKSIEKKIRIKWETEDFKLGKLINVRFEPDDIIELAFENGEGYYCSF